MFNDCSLLINGRICSRITDIDFSTVEDKIVFYNDKKQIKVRNIKSIVENRGEIITKDIIYQVVKNFIIDINLNEIDYDKEFVLTDCILLKNGVIVKDIKSVVFFKEENEVKAKLYIGNGKLTTTKILQYTYGEIFTKRTCYKIVKMVNLNEI